MFEEFFGKYLVETGKISNDDFSKIKDTMKTTRVKLGLIAVSEKLLTEKQSEEINRLQAAMDKRFGDIAVEKGYLTNEQVSHLLSLQGNAYMQLVSAITEGGYLSMEEIEASIISFKEAKNISDKDFSLLKSNDVDNIISVFVKSENELANRLIGLAIRNIIRFISTEVTFESLEEVGFLSFEHIATQSVKGDHSILLGFAGNDTSLLSIANPFAKEEFTAVDADSFDSVCEFINCINGLYASALSKENIEIDMEPPLFFDNCSVASDIVYKLPMTIAGKPVDLVAVVDNDYKIN